MLHSPRKHPQNQKCATKTSSTLYCKWTRHFTEHRLTLMVQNKYRLKNWLLLTPTPLCYLVFHPPYHLVDISCWICSHSSSPVAAGQTLNAPSWHFLPVTGSSPTECSEYRQALYQSHLKSSFAAQEWEQTAWSVKPWWWSPELGRAQPCWESTLTLNLQDILRSPSTSPTNVVQFCLKYVTIQQIRQK